MTAFEMGPVLYFRGLSEGRYHLAALAVTTGHELPPALQTSGEQEAPAQTLYHHRGKTVWRYAFSVSATPPAQNVTYRIGDQNWALHVPSPDRLRIAFCSCNGEAYDTIDDADFSRNERWRHLSREHRVNPFHLLIQGGDQLYADEIWRALPELVAWQQLSPPERLRAPWTPAMAEAAADFYFDRYCQLWAQPDVAPLLAAVPSVMMWDDHDIFDGWGSHAVDVQQCPVFQGLWRVAREHFALFQLGVRSCDLPSFFGDASGRHFGYSVTIGEVGVLLLDLRSERTAGQVMGERGWSWLQQTLDRMAACRQVFCVSSVPVAYLNWAYVERVLRWTGLGRNYHDDIRDQWRSMAHLDEWERMVTRLLGLAASGHTRVTILSGEIHLGGWWRLESGPTRIDQLISSGIVHHPPSSIAARLLGLWSGWPTSRPDGIRVQSCPLPKLRRRCLAARNWLSLDYGPRAQLQATWHVEGSIGDLGLTL